MGVYDTVGERMEEVPLDFRVACQVQYRRDEAPQQVSVVVHRGIGSNTEPTVYRLRC